ncbi:hypothetical protein L2E82_17637 [Cichorium intybus]|uniref:Uncharacterized protein n=1 Tax=Cichorium intybus TaxID=13427 RepID=A0ACB9F8P3_CICIN|nr:hypothetical protein L2E82_17637 [Cichorium intybus]
MEHQRNTQMNQTPTPPQQHYFANGFPFQSPSPAGLINTQQTPVNLPPSIDVDQSLANVISSLSISQNNHTDRRAFLPQSLDYEYGGVSSPIGGEGFISPFRSNSSSDERVSNAVNNHQRVYYGVGLDNPLTVDPLHRHHYQYSPLSSYNREFLPGTSSPWFDSQFDWDQRSYLLPKERLYSQHLNSYHNRSSSISFAAIRDESLLYSTNNHHNLHHTHNRNHGGMPNTLQNQQFLSLLPLNELRGMIYLLAKDQHGCRILQSKFENPTEEEILLVFSEVMGSISELMKDQFGNYVIQKLVAVCNVHQKSLILRELTRRPFDIILVSMNPYGTRAIQKLLENLEDPNQIMIVTRFLHRGAAKLANDPNGHHVIQSCLVRFDSDFNQLILEDIADNCFSVATDKSGCCVLQTCLDRSYGKIRNRLITEILLNAIQITEDPFGNYVLQHMVGMKIPELTRLIVRQLKGHFASLSRNKYASNVVEKLLTESGSDVWEKIVFELVKTPNPSSILLDPYGNFVIQSALKSSKDGLANECLEKFISRNVSSMQSNLYGKKVLETFDKRKILHI